MIQKFKIIIVFTLAFLIFLSVPVFFIGVFPGVEKFITKTLGIRIDPVLSGGEVMSVFNDKYFDDKGPGTYTYPNSEAYRPYSKHLDIIKYIIKKPVHSASWNEFKEFWAVELVMGDLANHLNAPAGFSFPMINIYINIDGKEGGKTDTLFPGANVNFDPKHPWHYCILITGWEIDGKLFNYTGEYVDKVLTDIIKKEDKLRITIPMEKSPDLKALSEKSITYHYVIVGNYDPVEAGNFRAITDKASTTTGGGNANPATAPRIYDYLAPSDTSQYKILSAYDSAKNKFAEIKPVKVILGAGLEAPKTVRLLSENEELYYENNRKKEIQKSLNQLTQRKSDSIEYLTQLVALYFQIGDYTKAEAIIAESSKKKEKNDPAPALQAYSGAITAIKAAQATSVLRKMELISRAITMLDKAAADLKDNTTDVLHVLMCRATVYSAIPESFRKLDTAIMDLEKLTKFIEDKDTIDLKINAEMLLGDAYAKKRLFKKALDQYHDALLIAPDEYHTNKLKDKIFEAESQYLEKLKTNL